MSVKVNAIIFFIQTNTFQCVLATNGNRSSAMFLYEQDGILWTTGDASGGTFGTLVYMYMYLSVY